MPDLSNQKRMASELLKVGRGRVWMDPTNQDDLEDAVTRQDIRSAIKAGVIRAKPVQGTSRGRARRVAEERARGRHAGPGSRRGTPQARSTKKQRWARRIRAQRDLLSTLRTGKKITPSVYRMFYRRAKGGMFRSRAHLLINLRIAGHLPAEAPT